MNDPDCFRPKPLVLGIASAFVLTQSPGALGACVTTGSTMDCEGTISSGVSLQSTTGGLNLTVNSGSESVTAVIGSAAAPGIRVSSSGTPAAPSNDALLNVPIPGEGVSGGEVTVNSFSTITTTGSGADGIVASSATSGYPSQVRTDLENFSDAGITFRVSSIKKPDGSDAEIGTAVSAKVAVIADVEGGLKQFNGFNGEAGTFTIAADGTVSFAMGSDFDNLANGESRIVAVDIVVDGYRNNVLKRSGETGQVVAQVTRNATTGVLEVTQWANFATFGESDKPRTSNQAWPDLKAYVAGLVDKAESAGGAGNSVTINHLAGTITTGGSAAYGIRAESSGRNGGAGQNAGGFWTFGTVPPTQGGSGNDGGDVLVRIDGVVSTTHEGAVDQPEQAGIGSLAHSQAGRGGKGGDGSTWYGGRRGGTGGIGGLAEVTGSGTVTTLGHNAIGIYALSEGGNGGNGGEGSFVNPGEKGGFGGSGGAVHVEGAWNITTGRSATDDVERSGDNAHGIWAKSVGGTAGEGGSGGWLAGASAGGGEGAAGGRATLVSGGRVETSGHDAYGLFGQSVGGFGGGGGAGGSIFYARGGDGSSAGSGGEVTVANQAGGEVITHGTGSHAAFAQSIGGGGGAGGGGGGVVGRGGSGGYGGTGGKLTLTNHGTVSTSGDNARGLYAQSVGGGGGDGGEAVGMVATGGTGSGTSDGGTVTLTNTGTVTTTGLLSNAIFAQSIGGGGGYGGSSKGWFSVGGDGGGGGNAGTVTVTNSGAVVRTARDDATAIFAQSIGGGGGKGGASGAIAPFASVAVGGNGAQGGTGNVVTVESSAGEILTSGHRSYGIFAQSIGGGGGDGGYAISGSIGLGASISVGVGGTGGGGGNSDKVTVTNHSHIRTGGDDADGIFAESIGGGGGVGGFSLSGAVSNGLAVTLNFGGAGGGGGDSNEVKVYNYGLIETVKDRSVGLQAQSVGGGGGRGGFSIAGSGAGLGAFTLGVGGWGGSGGDGKLVHVENEGTIDTQGTSAHGLLAQSIGGGGGSGGFNIAAAGAGTGAATIGIGGSGGKAGQGDVVEVVNKGKISTDGTSAVALFAQSVGGGGGSGGFSIAGGGAGTGAGTLNIGGTGDGGGNADRVTVNNSGNLNTLKADAYGLVAQSVGGGGGSGGFAIGVTGGGTGAGTVGIGGFGAGGGDGAEVTVDNEGAIDTAGARAVGLFAQSLGGGGGNGGFSISIAGAGKGAGTLNMGGWGAGGGNADLVGVTNRGRIVTQGDSAYGMLAQSLGGGGGNGGFSISGSGSGAGSGSIGVGGFGGGGGDGKKVTATNHGAVFTYGEHAAGLFAQSVGGGGGTGGFSIAGSGAKTGSVSFSLGGSGGDGGNSDEASLTNHGALTTYGGMAFGAIAQSVGGGGGAGGFSFAAGLTTEGFSLNGSVGGAGGDGGDARKSTLINHGTVSTLSAGAHGLVSQSVGGGGGAGGFSGTLTVGLGSKPNLSVSVGGSGGVAGNAREAALTNSTTVTTQGDAAYGLFAQSVGGGGGDGGGSLAVVLGKHDGAANLAVSIGGAGDGGGDAGNVTSTNTGTVITAGKKSHGIVAQSVGGGGGDGGFSASGVVAKGTNTKDLAVSVGGSAAEGGDADTVNVTNSGSVFTQGQGAAGIVAQSLGGGGGIGGFSFAGGFGGSQAKDLSVAVGGGGGDGGIGRTVTVINHGRIETGWTNPDPAVLSAALPSTPVATPSGGSSGTPSSRSSDDDLPPLPEPPDPPNLPEDPEALLIERYATYTAYGIFAQSIGGGGGSGGTSVSSGLGFGGIKDTWNINATVAVGGSGGSGNLGAKVDVANTASVTTRENDSHAIFAQSVGGGGGSGGSTYTATIGLGALNEGRSFNGNLNIGGEGGSGNLGGEVIVTNHGALATAGDLADGIRAQSIGGGGGSGGSSRSLNYILKAGSAKLEKDQASGTNVKTRISVGGDGGTGNDGGTVSVTSTANIVTHGTTSRGIFAQSVGGGGGSGGDGILGTGTAGDAFLELANLGLGSMGGGGNWLMSFLKGQLRDLSVAVGGTEGSSGDGKAVTVTNSGAITTYGHASTAIVAQSVGGGGGEVNAFASGKDSGGEALGGALGKVAIGGGAGASGDGGTVTVNNTNGVLDTTGNFAHGIFAQSVGGGGGVAGNVERAGSTLFGYGVGLGLDFAQDGGSAGNGGAVTVTSSGSITTRGSDAHGIMAQSIGGGGGMAGSLSWNPVALLNELVGLAGSVGGHGSAGTVTVAHTGNITTSGNASHGIFAQSAGGKTSPTNPQYLGVGGNVSVAYDGNLRIDGADGDGILAQSVGVDGKGTISVTVDGGSVQGGSGTGAGVRFLDGAANTLTNRGTVGALSGLAVVGSAAPDTIDNFGTLSGNVDLGEGANTIRNRANATFAPGSSVVVGNGRIVENAGTLSPGGPDRMQSTALTGSLSQGATGTILVDLDVATGAADHLAVSGIADLDGLVRLNLLNVARALPRSRVVEILSGQGEVTDAGLELADIDTAVFRNTLLFKADNRVVVQSVIDFSPDGLNRNQHAIGEHVNGIQLAGSSNRFMPIAEALFYLPDVPSLASVYDHMSAESYAHAQVGSVLSSMDFGDAMLSCRSREGQFRFVEEDECGWMRLSYRTLSRDPDREYFGFDEDSVGVAAGVQALLSEQWYAGLAFSFEDVSLDTDRLVRTDGMRAQAGFVLKGRYEADTVAVGLSGGHGSFDTRRRVGLPESDVEARADYVLRFLSGRLRWSHILEMQSWYLLPSLDLTWTVSDFDGFAERGAAGANLHVQGSTDEYFTVSPMLEIGGEIATAGGTLVRPFAKAGVDHFMSGLDPTLTASFEGAPDGVAPFTVEAGMDDTLVDVAAGVDILRPSGTVLRLNYVGQFGGELDGQGIFLRISMPL